MSRRRRSSESLHPQICGNAFWNRDEKWVTYDRSVRCRSVRLCMRDLTHEVRGDRVIAATFSVEWPSRLFPYRLQN